jgi:hypothetical protein
LFIFDSKSSDKTHKSIYENKFIGIALLPNNLTSFMSQIKEEYLKEEEMRSVEIDSSLEKKELCAIR